MPWGKACILQFTVQFPIISTVVHTKSYIHAPNWSPWASKLAIEFPWHVKLQKTQFISPSIICFFKKLNFSFISSFYAMFCCLKIQGGYLFFLSVYPSLFLCKGTRVWPLYPNTSTTSWAVADHHTEVSERVCTLGVPPRGHRNTYAWSHVSENKQRGSTPSQLPAPPHSGLLGSVGLGVPQGLNSGRGKEAVIPDTL